MREATLHLFKRAVTCRLNHRSDNDFARRQMVETLTADICGEAQNPFEYKTHLNWWEHLKDRWFPKWLLTKFPIKWQTHCVSVATIYPFLKTAIPAELIGDRIVVYINDHPIGSFYSDTDGMTPMEWNKEAIRKSFEERYRMSDRCPCCSRTMTHG